LAFVIPKAVIHNEGIRAVVARIVVHRFCAEVGLEFQKCLQCIWRQLSTLPGTIFLREVYERDCELVEVTDVASKEVAEGKKLTLQS